MEFRQDINGLRAIAIIGVIIFHFNKELLPGGFAGVDVFFVISGYLMTKIILNGLGKNSFSVWKFYYARAKRIIPALSAACLLCLLIGWTILLPKDYLELSRNAISSMLFFSNYWYATQNGYFDTSAVDNILLHTWSLSVEWQFYLIYPIIILLIHKFFGGKISRHFIVAGLILSLFVSIFRTPLHPTDSYFTLAARAWEMLAGGLAFIINEKSFFQTKPRRWEAIGLTMILLSYFMFDESTIWPGYNAALPVFGTVLIIAASRNNSIITANQVMQYIGKISYSLYLIHWPLIVFARKVDFHFSTIPYALIALLFASAMYFAVERAKTFSFANLSVVFIALPGSIYVRNTNGAIERVPEELRLSSEEFQRKYYGGYGYKTSAPYFSHTSGDVDYIIFGDSFASQYSKSIDKKSIKSINIFFHGCPIMPSYSRYRDGKEDPSCSIAYGQVKKILTKYNKSDVIFASAWDNYKDLLIKRGGIKAEKLTSETLAEVWIDQIKKISNIGSDRIFYIIGRPISTNKNSYGCLAQNVLPGYSFFSKCSPSRSKVNIEINDRLKSEFSKSTNIKFIDPNDVLCNKNTCVVMMGDNPVYIDGAHLSVYGAEMVFNDIFKRITSNNNNN